MVGHLWIKDDSRVLTSYPPKYAWECARCGAVATTEGGMPSTDGCAAHDSLEKLRTRIGESGFTLAQRVQLENLVDDAELRLKLAEGRRKTERNNFEQVCAQRDRLKEQRKVLQAEVYELREKIGRMAETDARLDAMRRDLENTIAERDECYMKLPVDADDVPIRPGDIMRFRNDAPVRVDSIGTSRCYEGDYGWFGGNGGFYGNGTLSECRHVKPDTLESLLVDMVKDIASEHVIYVPDDKKDEFGARLRDIRDDYAERIREAVDNGD